MSPISGNEFKWATDPFLADGKVKVASGGGGKGGGEGGGGGLIQLCGDHKIFSKWAKVY